MSKVYITRHPFRSYGDYYDYGSVVEDLDKIKRGRLKVQEGKLIPLDLMDEEAGQEITNYFQTKVGVDITPNLLKCIQPVKQETETKGVAKSSTASKTKVNVKAK